MNISVFGAGGFVGQQVCEQLSPTYRVTPIYSHRHRGTGKACDIKNWAHYKELDHPVDVVVNCAAKLPRKEYSPEDIRSLFEVNAVGASHVARWAADRGATALVNLSSLSVISRPWPVPVTEESLACSRDRHAPYGISKLAGEICTDHVGRAAQIQVCHLRLSSVYGRGMRDTGVLPLFIRQAREKNRICAFSNHHIDLIHVRDVARAVESAVASQAQGVFNICSQEEVSIECLARLISSDVEVIDNGTVDRAVASGQKAADFLQFRAITPLSEGLRELMTSCE